MENNDKITDELIAKYISGKTTEEEDLLVHEYLAQNPEFADDLLNMATAIRHQGKHDEAMANKGEGQVQEAARVSMKSRRTFYAVAASVVLLIGVGFLFFLPFAKNEEQPVVAEIVTETEQDTVNASGNDEENVSDETPVVSFDHEQPLIADVQETSKQKTENTVTILPEDQYIANNTTQDALSEQELENADDAAMMASQTVYEEEDEVLKKEDAVFETKNMPDSCDLEKDLVLKWDCNATLSLTLEFSTDDGKTWNKPSYDITGHNHYTIKRNQLKGFTINNPFHSFCWRMTAEYSDGKLVRQGTIRFTE